MCAEELHSAGTTHNKTHQHSTAHHTAAADGSSSGTCLTSAVPIVRDGFELQSRLLLQLLLMISRAKHVCC
jgi:hypothetical protein